jgi:hypothetical protein
MLLHLRILVYVMDQLMVCPLRERGREWRGGGGRGRYRKEGKWRGETLKR